MGTVLSGDRGTLNPVWGTPLRVGLSNPPKSCLEELFAPFVSCFVEAAPELQEASARVQGLRFRSLGHTL